MTIDFDTIGKAVGVVEIEPVANNGVDPLPGNDDPPDHECDEHGNTIEPSAGLPAIVDALDFTATELPDPKELITGMAHQGTKMVIGGGSKSFKTWIQLDCALSIAYGLDWLGHPCTEGRVLFVNLEIKPSFFHKRILKVCEARGINQAAGRLDVWNLRGHSAPYRILLPQITERIKSTGYAAIFLDPVYKLYGNTDENNASEVAQLLNGFEKVCVDTDALVAFGAHYSKGNQSAKETIDRISGSGVFARDPDSIINFTRHEDEDAFVVEPILRNLKPVEPFVVRWKYPLMRRDDDADPSKLKQVGGKQREYDPIELLAVIRKNTSENPISVNKWAELAGVNRTTLMNYLDIMRTKGWIITIGEGTHSRKAITEKGVAALP